MGGLNASLYFILFGIGGTIIPFSGIWLREIGLNAESVGILLAVSALLKVFSNPCLMYWLDRTSRIRLCLVLLLSATTVLYLLLVVSNSIYFVVVCYLLVAFIFPPVYPALDRFTMSLSSVSGYKYGSRRLWGSLGFVVFANIGGYVFEFYSVSTYPVVLSCFCAVALVVSLLVPGKLEKYEAEDNLYRAEEEKGKSRDRRSMLEVVIACSLIQGSNAFLYAYGGMIWIDGGLSESSIAIVWLVGVSAEVLMFLVVARFMSSLGVFLVLLVVCFGTIFRWLLLGVSVDIKIIFVAQLLQALTISCNNAVIMAFINKKASHDQKARYIGYFITFGTGVFMSALTYIVLILDMASSSQGYFVMIAPVSIALFLVWRNRTLLVSINS